jgi:FkbM family methyltransferase
VKGGGKDEYLTLLRTMGVRYKVVKVNNCRMKIDLRDNIISRYLFVEGSWEPYESQLIKRLLLPGMTVIDIGAHVGYHSLLAAQAVGTEGQVISFEPSPDNFALLTENIALNGFSELIHAENAALADHCGELELFLSSYNTGDHRVYPTLSDDDEIFNAGAQRQSVKVPALKLDDYLSQHDISRVDMIKMDVQGAEMGVLSGMKQTLLRNPRLLLFTEFWPHGLRRFGTEPQDVLSFLTDEIGLSLFHVQPEEERVVPVMPASFASETRNVDPLQQIDLLCCASPSAALMERIR